MKLTAPAIKNLQNGTTISWALESHAAAQLAYQYPANLDLDETYFKKAKPVLDAQLLKGGLRLARVLNEALGK